MREIKMGFHPAFWGTLMEQSNGRLVLLVKRASLALLFALIVIGVLLRFLRLGENSLWIDEIYMLITVKHTFWVGIFQLEDYSAPLYQLILRLVTHTPFPSEALLRLPAVFFGCLAIAAAWWFGRTLFGSQVGLLVATIIALNPPMLHHSMEARPYTLFTLTATLSMTFFFRLMKGIGRMNNIGYVFLTSLLVYSHFYGLLVLAAQVLYLTLDRLALRRQDRRANPLGAITVVCCLSLPSVWLAFRYAIAGGKGIMGGWMPSYGWINSISVFGELVFGQPVMGGLFLIPLIAAVWPGASAFDFQSCSCPSSPIAQASSLWERKSPAILCTLWVMVSIYPLIAMSHLYRPMFQPKYALPIVVPLVSMAISFIHHFRRGIIVLSMVAFLAISAPIIYSELKPGTGMRELVGWVNKNVGEEEEVYTLHFPYCDEFIDPGEIAMQYYGYRKGELIRLPMVGDLSSVKVGLQGDPFPRNKRSYIAAIVFREQVEAFLNSIRREYQVQPYGRSATIFIIEPVEKGK